MEDDDSAFYGYVESTVNPGPALLVITIAISFLFLATLPVAVILGDKREQRQKQKLREQQEAENRDNFVDDDENASLSSRATYYSAISGVIKDALDQTGKPPRTRARGGHRRHRHRRRNTHGSTTTSHKEEIDQVCENFVKKPDEISDNVSESSYKKEGHRTLSAAALEEKMQGEIPPPPSELDGSHTATLTKATPADIDDDKEDYRNNCMSVQGLLDELAAIMAWDVEMKRIIKLTIPFATQAFFTGALEISTVGVVGKLIGTREVSAFVVVNMLVAITTEFVGGFPEAFATLCSQAIGAKNYTLAGQYVQIATILHSLSSLPFMILWVIYIDEAMEWLGFDDETVRIGKQYTYVLVVDYWITGISDAIHGLLDVGGFENYSTMIGVTEEALAFFVILIWALIGNPDLMSVAYVQFFLGLVFLFLNAAIIYYKGWFQRYHKGMFGMCGFKNGKAVVLVLKTASSLSFGYLLTDGEWELLTIFASFLGPAEVAAWGIFGSIWDAINALVDSIADASEVRCAFLLGSGFPERARLSAFKSLIMCIFTALFLTSGLFIAGDDLPTLLTNDATLQHLLRDLLPMFGLGNASMALGTMAWTLLGAQGRYRLATIVVGLVSWCVTLPLAAFFSIYLNVDLQGQTSAVVIGYMLSGSIHAYFLFRSDWEALSEKVMDDNESREDTKDKEGENK